ncbi:hypothetical protein E4U60_004046 [Claviceps pazoutovae]|uniref:Uncharacterized protein n=1 Tax=Claviceps pazoutovae TaxID=1649127 RepID=A0A9P7M9K1_9HYPO|nr:hypothetical protein E4U60_004046 [Claviceps pazoutovae]
MRTGKSSTGSEIYSPHSIDAMWKLKKEPLRLKSEEEDGITEIKRFGDICKVVPAYERLRERLEQTKVEVVVRPELSYYASHINAAWTVASEYFAKLDETPLFYAAMVLHPGIQWDDPIGIF